MKPIRPSFWLSFMLLASMTLYGCVHAPGEGVGTALIVSTEAFKHFNGEFENTEYYKKHKPGSVSVLPFQFPKKGGYFIDSAAGNPANVVRRGMYNHVASLPFKDLEIYNTDRRLSNAGLSDIRNVDALIAENPKKLRSLLGVDAVISGSVTHFDRIFAGIYSQVAVGCEVKMWDLKTGKLLWRAKHVSRAHAGGISLNPIGLAMATVAALWNLRQTELLSQTDELFREIVSSIEIPESALAVQAPPPKIDLFAALNADKPYTLGKKAAFRIIGDPGCSAYVDLGDYKSGIQLAPVSGEMKSALRKQVIEAIKKNIKETGHEVTPDIMAAVEQELASREIYEGVYTVEPGEEIYGLIAKSYLVNTGGDQGTAIDAANTIDIDSLPPKASTGLSTVSLDTKIKMRWNQNTEKDLAGYEIWSSSTPLSGYKLAAKSEKNETILSQLQNFAPFFVRVRATDRASNMGPFSSHLKAIALPEPGIYALPHPGPALGGEIKDKVFLVAEKNPYTVSSDLTVIPGGILYIEPGVELLFAPYTVLKVTGGELLAYGQKDRPIRFTPKTAGSEPGAWQGVVLENSPRSLLQNVMIQKANIGLTIRKSAPTISASTISGSAHAGLLLRDQAKPNISCSVFRANEGQGALVIEGEGLAPVIHNNTFQNNNPFQVQSYTPLEVDLKNNYWGRSVPDENWFLGQIVWKPVLSEPPRSCP